MAALDLSPAMLAAVDLRDEAGVTAAIEAATERFGPVELLVSNAGVMPLGDLIDQPLSDWREAIEVNTLAAVSVIQSVLSDMVSRQRGTIVVVSSLAARQVFDHHGAYCASKAATHAMVEALRKEVGVAGVRVVEVAPGMVETALTDTQSAKNYLDERPHQLQPEDVGEVIAWVSELPQRICVREVHVANTWQD